MSNRFFSGFLEESARGAQVRMRHDLDLNFPPPDQNVGQVGLCLGPSAPGQMQAAEHGQLQPQSMDNVHAMNDEISILSPTVFSETWKNHYRDLLRFRRTNNNLGVYRGYNHVNEFMEVYGTYSQMDLVADMQLYSLFEDSGMLPSLFHFPKRRRTGPHPFDVPANLPVNRPIKEARDVPVSLERDTEATLDCPICLDGLREETSTKCGHIFCKQCIEKAIVAQHKCPTCRRKLKKNDTIRIYLPRSAA